MPLGLLGAFIVTVSPGSMSLKEMLSVLKTFSLFWI
jgi:hypothetical protein